MLTSTKPERHLTCGRTTASKRGSRGTDEEVDYGAQLAQGGCSGALKRACVNKRLDEINSNFYTLRFYCILILFLIIKTKD